MFNAWSPPGGDAMADHHQVPAWKTSLSIRLPFDERILIKVVKLTPGQGS
jgi:hypothetical protein